MIDIEKYFNQFSKYRKKPSLDIMKYFIEQYHNFDKEMNFIHVAGTNGKGSTVEMMSCILEQEGYNVGKFISPHLIRYNERIKINDKEISNKEMSDLIEEIIPKIEKYQQEKGISVNLFEILTMIALLYFYRNKVDFVVLETGLGGLYDSTNIISHPLISIITSIGYDHMQILGNTLPAIAYRKAGIIKQNSHTVFFEQNEEINNVIIKVCQEKKNKLHLIKKEQIENYTYDNQYQYFDSNGLKKIAVNLKGKVQLQNAALCIQSIKILNNLGYHISEKSLRKGLSSVIHKGRMELLKENPIIIYDGAHNEPAIKNLQDTILQYYKFKERVYIISILKGKDAKKILSLLLKDEKATFIFTTGNDKQSYIDKQELYNMAIEYKKEGQKIEKKSLEEAIKIAVQSEKKQVANFIVGSFYIYKSVLDIIQKFEKENS